MYWGQMCDEPVWIEQLELFTIVPCSFKCILCRLRPKTPLCCWSKEYGSWLCGCGWFDKEVWSEAKLSSQSDSKTAGVVDTLFMLPISRIVVLIVLLSSQGTTYKDVWSNGNAFRSGIGEQVIIGSILSLWKPVDLTVEGLDRIPSPLELPFNGEFLSIFSNDPSSKTLLSEFEIGPSLLVILAFRLFFLILVRRMKQHISGFPRTKKGWMYDPVSLPVFNRLKP